MIVVSGNDKQAMQTLLKNYDRTKFDVTISKASQILEKYYPSQPTKLGKRLLDKLFSSWMNKSNEAFVDYWVLNKLVYEYGYPTEQLDLEVPCGALGRQAVSPTYQETHADIVVYSHESRRPATTVVTVECRELGGVNGARQAASYSRALQSRYHLFTDSELWESYRTMPHPLDGLRISDIPHWIGYRPVAKRLPKTNTLPPITDEKQLRELVKYCHDSIHGEGVDPAKAFDELVKLFFVKVYDEQEIPDDYQFSVLEGESTNDVGNHIRRLLKQAKEGSKYKELFFEPGDDEFGISNESISKVVETFQGFSFTGDTLIGIDVKGTVYENMVGATFRGELGQYFTPRKIVEFMVALLKPTREDLVLDPACGSGGFLIKVLREVAIQVRVQQQNLSQPRAETIIGQFANNNIYGCDISPRMVRASRMNMIMHGDGWTGIQRCHGLMSEEYPLFKEQVGEFTLILSNPPFAGFEGDDNILAKFETGKNEAGRIRGVNRAIVFVEQIINLLKDGGRAGIVLPRSIFENESYSFKSLRQLIYSRCEIIAIIGLPRTAFHHTDCGILGDLLFIRKCSEPREDYNVFVARANNVGYNTLGHNIEENDFTSILSAYNNQDESFVISIRKLIAEDNLNPWHYDPRVHALKKTIEKQSDLVPLHPVLVSVYNNRISRKASKQTPERVVNYVQVRDFALDKGQFNTTKHTIKTLPSRATYEMNGDELILLPNARNSLESKRRVIKVGEEMRGYVLTNRFTPLIPKVNPDFLVMMLNTDFVRDQLITACRGAGSPDLRDSKLSEIMIPVPDKDDLSSIDSFMEGIVDNIAKRNDLEKELIRVNTDIQGAFKRLYKSK